MPPLSPRGHSNSQSLNNGLAIFSIHRLGSRVETSFQTPTISQIHYETQKNKCFPKFPCNGILLVLLFQAVYIFPVHKFGLDPGETELLSLVPFFSKPIDKAYSLNQTADVSLLCSKYLYLYLGLNLGHGHGLHCKLVRSVVFLIQFEHYHCATETMGNTGKPPSVEIAALSTCSVNSVSDSYSSSYPHVCQTFFFFFHPTQADIVLLLFFFFFNTCFLFKSIYLVLIPKT